MAIKPVVQTSDPVLHKKSAFVEDFNAPIIKETIVDLIDTMRGANLIGMAAPQIGISQQIFVTEIRKTKYRNPKDTDSLRIFINPKIIKRSRMHLADFEGCGSLRMPALFAKINRSKNITVSAFDWHGKLYIINANDLLARVIQHETDHLNGIMCIEKQEKIISEDEYLKMVNEKKQ